MTELELQEAIRKAVAEDRAKRIPARLWRFTVNARFIVGVLIGVLLVLPFAAGNGRNLARFLPFPNIVIQETVPAIAASASNLPGFSEKAKTISAGAASVSALIKAGSVGAKEAAENWTIQTANLRQTFTPKDWKAIADRLDSLLRKSGFSAACLDDIAEAFDNK